MTQGLTGQRLSISFGSLFFYLENDINTFTAAGNFQFFGLGKRRKFIGDVARPPQQLSMPWADRRGDRLGECEA